MTDSPKVVGSNVRPARLLFERTQDFVRANEEL
jgi:hypothetical protein